MIGYLLKNWKLLLDLILVVGGIIALALFDPFGIFTRTTLRSTANLVSSVRSIGELVTAEYYGEVIGSLHETQVFDVPVNTLIDEFEDCYTDIKSTVVEHTYNANKKSKKIVDDLLISAAIGEIKTEFEDNKIYDEVIAYLAINTLSGKLTDYYKDGSLQGKTEKMVLQNLVDKTREYKKNIPLNDNRDTIGFDDFSEFINDIPSYFNGITDFHYRLNEKEVTEGKNRKRDIVFIGRGWVKAGFSFDNLDESNFFYDEDAKLVRFYGLTPSILDKDINPWFIPEKRIKGFELVEYYKKASFEEAIEVKQRCKEKLLAQAQNAGIMNQSRTNGEEALQSFFSLLLDEPDLEVELHSFPFEDDFQMITADTMITVQEALRIDTIYRAIINDTTALPTAREDNERLFAMLLNRFSAYPFINNAYQFNFFSLYAARILEHKLLVTQADYNWLKSRRGTLQLFQDPEDASDSIISTKDFVDQRMLKPYPSFVEDFNKTMDLLEQEFRDLDDLRNEPVFIDSLTWSRTGQAVFVILDTSKLDATAFYKVRHVTSRDFNFNHLRFPVFEVDERLIEELGVFEADSVASILDDLAELARNDKNNLLIDSALLNRELKIIQQYESRRLTRQVQMGPVAKLLDRIR